MFLLFIPAMNNFDLGFYAVWIIYWCVS